MVGPLVSCVVLLCVFTFRVPCCHVQYNDRMKTMFGSSLATVVCRRAHVLFILFVFVSVLWYPTHIALSFCFVFLRLVYSMLQVSLDCPFLIDPSVFSNVYYTHTRDRSLCWVGTCASKESGGVKLVLFIGPNLRD